MHIVHDDELAHDLVQDTWLAAMRSAPPGDDKVRPWLAGVLRNLARMSVRTAVRRRDRERAGMGDDQALPSADALLERLEAQQLLLDEVQRLDEPYRTTILLLYAEGLPASDIADRLDVPDSTVRWPHRQALESLRKVLAEKDPQRRRLKALLLPVGGAAAAIEVGYFGGKSVWAGLAVMLASVLSLWPSHAPVPARAAAAFPAHGLSARGPALPAAAVVPGARARSPGAAELVVRVTDVGGTPVAAARARIGELDVGSTRADGLLAVAARVRPRIPRAGTIAVEAAGYRRKLIPASSTRRNLELYRALGYEESAASFRKVLATRP